jgi:hypothetical protein
MVSEIAGIKWMAKRVCVAFKLQRASSDLANQPFEIEHVQRLRSDGAQQSNGTIISDLLCALVCIDLLDG